MTESEEATTEPDKATHGPSDEEIEKLKEQGIVK